MEVLIGNRRTMLIPTDIEEEMSFETYPQGAQIRAHGPTNTPYKFYEVLDRVVCLRVKRIQDPTTLGERVDKWLEEILKPKPKRKWWHRFF